MKVFERLFKKRPIGLSRADMVHAVLNWMDDSKNHSLISSCADWAELVKEEESNTEKHSALEDDVLWKPIEDKGQERKLNEEFWDAEKVRDEMVSRIQPKAEDNGDEPDDWDELNSFVESLKDNSNNCSEEDGKDNCCENWQGPEPQRDGEEEGEPTSDSGGATSPTVPGDNENEQESADENDLQVEDEEVVEDDVVVGSQLMNDVMEQEASPYPSWTEVEIGEMYQSHLEQNSTNQEGF